MEANKRILLVCKRVRNASSSAEFLKKCNLEFTATGTVEEARKLLRSHHFRFVLTEPELPDGTGAALKDLLKGKRSSLYVSFPVRDGCWWLPVVDAGRECMGQAALRPSEMVALLMEGSPMKNTPRSAQREPQAAVVAGGK